MELTEYLSRKNIKNSKAAETAAFLIANKNIGCYPCKNDVFEIEEVENCSRYNRVSNKIIGLNIFYKI